MAGFFRRIGEYLGNSVIVRNYFPSPVGFHYSSAPTQTITPADVAHYDAIRNVFHMHSTGPVLVSEETAISLSSVYACVRVLSEGVASLPWLVYEYKDGKTTKAVNHPCYQLVHSEPNKYMSSFSFREAMMAQCCLWGNAYAQIERKANGRPEGFHLFLPKEVSITTYKNELYYDTPKGLLPYYDVIHVAGLGFDGIIGKSPIRMQAESMGVSLAAQRFGSNFFKNGAHLGGILSHPGILKKDARENLESTWKFKHGGVENVGATAILEEGMKYERIGIPPEEAQFIETRKFGRSEIAAIYRVPLHMIQDLERATFSNIEHQDLAFVKHSLVPWLIRFEQEFNRKIFRESEKGRFYTKFNVNGLLRGDSAARAAFYKELWSIGVLTHNDILELEDMNTYEGGDRRFVPVNNMAPIDMIDQIMSQNTTQGNGNRNQDRAE